MASTPEESPRSQRSLMARLLGVVVTQSLALAFFIGIPAMVTAIAPVSWLTLTKRPDGTVKASVQTCLLFVVPYKTVGVERVTGVSDRVLEGSTTRQRRRGPDRETKGEDEGILIIEGEPAEIEVWVSPQDLDSVVARTEAFLDEAASGAELRQFVVANWKFSVIAGGLISSLTVLYVGALAFGLVLKLVHLAQGIAGVPRERRWLARAAK